MYVIEYTIREHEQCLADVFFKQSNIEEVLKCGEYKAGWHVHQSIVNIGSAINVGVTFYPGGYVASVSTLNSPDDTQLKDIAIAVENAGGRLFNGLKRIYGHPKTRKKAKSPTHV